MSWHILTVAPQAEFKVRDDLHELGLSAVVPVEFRLRKAARNQAPKPLRRARVPGYVFADVDDYHALHNVKGWTGSIAMDGRPYVLTAQQVAAVQALSVPLQAMEVGSRWRVGDRIAIKRGAIAELTGIIEIIKRGKARVRVDMLGKQHRNWIDLNEVA